MTDGVFNGAPAEAAPDPSGDFEKRLADKDGFIGQLQTETAEMREAIKKLEAELEAKRLIEEARNRTLTPEPPEAAKPAAPAPASPPSEDELVERVLKAQEQRTAEAQARANVQSVSDHLVELYGSQEAATKVVTQRASELGVGVDFLLSTARQSTKAFYDLMKLETAPKQERAPNTSLNAAALQANAPGVAKPGTPEYYEQLRKEKGDAYFYTPKVQQQRMKDMKAYYAANGKM